MINGIATSAATFLTIASQSIQRHPKRVTAIIAALLLGCGGGVYALASLAPNPSELPVRVVQESVQAPLLLARFDLADTQPLTLYRSDVTRSTDTAETLLKRLGVDDAQAAAFLRADASASQVLLGRGGRSVTAEASGDNTLIKLSARWSPDDSGRFKRLVLEKTAQGFVSRIEDAALVTSTRLASGTIQTSLFAATDDANIPDAIAIQVAEIFSGDIDFHRALRQGDRFSIVYETLEGDGEPLRSGRVLSAEFVNNGKAFQAMWFQEPPAGVAQGNGALAKGGYFTLDGQSLRRAFLASPMEFSRVTSSFKMRFHPVLKRWRAHLGVDYAGSTGTLVRSVGDGVVEFAGVQNGFGNVVYINHGKQQTTVYAHLSRINVRKGESVDQNQTIGAVGATGWVTGPHLHFEFRVNGQHRDPLTLARQSETVQLSAAARPIFNQVASSNRLALAAAASLQKSSAQ